MAIDEDQWRLERAKIAMDEYKVLHAEILQRNTIFNQVIAALAGAGIANFAAYFNGSINTTAASAVVLLGLLVFFLAWFLVDSDARRASARIQEIEEFVNSATGGDDKNPLSWERRAGLVARGYIDRVKGK